jgi:hypothetical protein
VLQAALADQVGRVTDPLVKQWLQALLDHGEWASGGAPRPGTHPPRSKSPASGEEAAEAGAQKVADASINGRAAKHKRRSKGVRKN